MELCFSVGGMSVPDYIKQTILACIATLDLGSTSALTDNGDGTWTHDDGNGTTEVIDPGNVVDNGDGTYTVTNADGRVVTITAGGGSAVPSSMVDNGDGTWTHTNGEGVETIISTGNVADNGDGTATATFPDGSTATVCTDCAQTIAADNGDGTWTITNPDGSEVVISPAGGEETALVVTTNGTDTDVAQSGTANHTLDITLPTVEDTTPEDGSATFSGKDAVGNPTTCELSTDKYDDSDPCEHLFIDTKTGNTRGAITRREENQHYRFVVSQPGFVLNENAWPAAGDALTSLSLTVTNPSDCRNAILSQYSRMAVSATVASGDQIAILHSDGYSRSANFDGRGLVPGTFQTSGSYEFVRSFLPGGGNNLAPGATYTGNISSEVNTARYINANVGNESEVVINSSQLHILMHLR